MPNAIQSALEKTSFRRIPSVPGIIRIMKPISPSLSVSFHAWKNPHNAYAGFSQIEEGEGEGEGEGGVT
jgi:hypothetical protein